MSTFAGRKLALALGILLWGALVVHGTRLVLDYDLAPGQAADPPSRWPARTALAKPAGKFALVFLAHPDCPCTLASLHELAVVMARSGGRIVASVVFVKPGAADAANTSSWELAASIPGVTASFDREGVEAARFRGRVSGQTFLYSPAGDLLFNGGITASRGHEGASLGRAAILAHVTGIGEPAATAPVFGCSLADPERA